MGSNGYEMCDDFAQTTTATLGGVSGFDYCWLDVRTRVGGYDLTSSIWCRVRTNETPRASASVRMQDVLFVNDDHRAGRFYPVDFQLTFGAMTNGHVKLTHNGDTGAEFYSGQGTNGIVLVDEDFEAADHFDGSFTCVALIAGRGHLR